MTVYFITFGLSIALYCLLTFRKTIPSAPYDYVKGRAIFPFVVSAAPLVLVSGLRYNVGTDYFNTYYTGFYRVLNGVNFDHFEIGYWILTKIVQVFSDNAFVMLFLASLITIGFIFAAFRSLSNNVAFSIFLLFISRYYFISMNGVRQMMACAVLLFALKYAITRSFKKYFALCLLATSFHYSAIIVFPVYWLMNIEWNRTRLAIVFSASAVLGLFAFPVLVHIVPAGSKMGVILQSYGLAGPLFTIGTILLNLFILTVYYLARSEGNESPWFRCFFTLQVFACASTLFLPSIPVIERIYWSFSLPSVVAIPGILKTISVQWVRIIGTVSLVAVLFVYTVFDIGYLKDHQVVPYSSIIGHKAVHSSDFSYRETHGLNWW